MLPPAEAPPPVAPPLDVPLPLGPVLTGSGVEAGDVEGDGRDPDPDEPVEAEEAADPEEDAGRGEADGVLAGAADEDADVPPPVADDSPRAELEACWERVVATDPDEPAREERAAEDGSPAGRSPTVAWEVDPVPPPEVEAVPAGAPAADAAP